MRYRVFTRRALSAALVAVVALLAACGSGTSSSSSRPTPTLIRTATPTALPTVLYSADWSKGADGWTLPAHWSIKDGALLNDGTGTTSITVPYTVTATDYEVDLVARVVNVATPQSCGNLYGMQALDTNGQQLYQAQIYCIGTNPQNPGESVLYVPADAAPHDVTADFVLNNDFKTYRVIVHGKGIRYFPNSPAAVGGANARIPLSPASFELLDAHVQLMVTHFTVLKLIV